MPLPDAISQPGQQSKPRSSRRERHETGANAPTHGPTIYPAMALGRLRHVMWDEASMRRTAKTRKGSLGGVVLWVECQDGCGFFSLKLWLSWRVVAPLRRAPGRNASRRTRPGCG